MAEVGTPKKTPNARTSRRVVVGLAAGLAVVAAAVLPAAGAASTGPKPAGAPTTVTYTKQTVLVSTATLKKQLLSISANGATYTFKTKHGVLGRLKKGSVMLLQDVAVRDVTKTARSHGHFVVTTTPAAITDLIANGTISWNKPVKWSNGFAVGPAATPTEDTARARTATSIPAMLGLDSLASGKTITLKGKTHTYTYSVSFTKEGSAVALAITISKSSPVEVKATITGTLDNLTAAGNISVNHGSLSNAKLLANHLTGSFKLAYSAKPISAFGLGQAGGVKVSLPAEIAVPFFVGPVPFFLGINVAFFASAGFSGYDQSVSGSYTFKYDGEGGITTDSSGATTGAGVLKGVGDIILKAANAVKTGPVSFIFGAQMPQVELGLGVKGLNVAGNVTLIGSTGIATYGPGCDTRQMEVEGSAGVEANFFGFSAGPDPVTLFDEKVQAAYPAGCGVFPTTDAVRALSTTDR